MSSLDDPAIRLRRIQKQREQEHAVFQKAVSKVKEQIIVKPITEKFASKVTTEDDLLRQETIGLQSLSDFRKKRQRIESGVAPEADDRDTKRTKTAAHSSEATKLSFNFDDEDEENESDQEKLKEKEKEEKEEKAKRYSKLGKDPTIDTSFLPDKGRDEFLEQQRRRLQIEWLQQQEEIKEAPFSIDYCFYDGTSHKKNMVIKRGYSIKEFLTVAKKQFPDIQDASTDLLLFVKENIILPHHYTFYELIEAKGNGQQTSCLDNWCQPESSSNPSPTTPILSSRSSALAHTAKIVEKNFYDRNKHLHPFNLWEVFTEKTSTLK